MRFDRKTKIWLLAIGHWLLAVSRQKPIANVSLQFLIFNLLTACSGQYIGQPREAMLLYQTQPTYGSLYELSDAYAQTINAALKDDTLHPGMYADYGVALALMGYNDEACRMMNAEVAAFPQSNGMVRRITGRLLPGCTIDTSRHQDFETSRHRDIKTSRHQDFETSRLRDWKSLFSIDTAQLHRWAYDSVAALQPLPMIAPVIDSTDTVQLALQTPVDSVEIPIRLTANQKRERLAEEQARDEKLRKMREDSIAAAKQAKIDERNQAKVDKKKAKKEKERAKKAADKAKKRAAAERKKQQELQKKQKQKDKKQKK